MTMSTPAAERWQIRPAALLLGWLLLASGICAADIPFTNEEVAWLAERPVVRVGVPTGFNPVSFAENGEWQGVAADFTREVTDRIDLNVELITSESWPELQASLRRGDIDAIPLMFWTKERSLAYSFTRPYVRIDLVAYTRDDDTQFNGMADLRGYSVAIPEGVELLERLAATTLGTEFIRVATFTEAIRTVSRGDADVAFVNEMVFEALARAENVTNLRPAFRAPLEGTELHFVTRRDLPVLRNIVQKGLDAIPEERAVDIMARWEGNSSAVARPDLLGFSDAEQDYLAAHETLSTCVQSNALPFESYDSAGHSGATSVYTAIIAERLGKPVKTVRREHWPAVESALAQGRCDFAMLAVDTSRAEIVLGAPWQSETLALVTADSQPFIDNIEDLSGVRVGVVQGFASLRNLRQRFPDLLFEGIESRSSAYDRVASRELFGVVDLVPTASHELRSRDARRLKISAVIPGDDAGIRVAASSPLLSSILDKVIISIPAVQRDAMMSGWSSGDEATSLDMQTLLPVIIGLSVILAIVLVRLYEQRGHRQEMRRKTDELERINDNLKAQKHSAMHLAYHDQLTGLSNRSKLMLDSDLAIKRAERSGNRLALLFLDLDRFKYVNDSLGHDVGDKLLVSVARRMQGLLRDTDQLCRLGGDEFIVVLEDIDGEYSPQRVSERIIEAIGKPFMINGQSISVGTSIGISLYPENSDDFNTLLKYADSAMYAAKEGGRNAYRYFRDEMSSKASRRIMIESALREALDNNAFSLALQPIVCLKTGRVRKAEALIRWEHPVVGPIAPDEFIPIAEEVGLIVDIGEWVYRSCCNLIGTLDAMQQPIESLSINVSSVEFARGDIASRFAGIAKECQVEASKIELEITERHMLSLDGNIENALLRISEMGHRISIDDFGTGYSSLSYLKRFPLSTIKIDRSFIASIPRDQNDIEISQAIISLSHALGYDVTAEGVETEEQARFLVERGCDCAQGYYFSRTVTVEEFLDTVDELNRRLDTEISRIAKAPAFAEL